MKNNLLGKVSLWKYSETLRLRGITQWLLECRNQKQKTGTIDWVRGYYNRMLLIYQTKITMYNRKF